jgi:hypothetical protein
MTNQTAIISFKCNCGFKRFGVVMDDPSCVLDTAEGALKEQIKEHLAHNKPGCWTYDAIISPGFV